MGGITSPTALKMAVIFENRRAASESAIIEKDPSAALGNTTQNIPMPMSIAADTKLDQIPTLMCLGKFSSNGK